MGTGLRADTRVGLRYFAAWLIACSAFLLASTTQLLVAQDDSNAAPIELGATATPPVGELIDLVLVANVPGNLSAKELQEGFADAFKVSDAFRSRGVSIEQISSAEYSLLKLLIESPERFVPGMNLTPPIEPHADGSNEWRIHQDDPQARLAGITVRYEEGKQAKEEFFPTGDAQDEKARFRVDPPTPGEYRFRDEKNWKLIGFSLRVSGSEKDSPVDFQPWPERNRKYLIRLTDFSGDRKKLFDVMGEKVVNRLVNVSAVRPGLFSKASFRSVVSIAESTWEGNLFTLRFGRLGGELSARRMWMLFPLSSSQRDEVVKMLADEKYTPKSLAEGLAKGKVKYSVSRGGGDAATPLLPGDDPQWWEVPAVYDGNPPKIDRYTRTFLVQDIPGWLKRSDEEPVYAITLYEALLTDNKGNPVADGERIIRVTDKSSLWQSQEISQWPAGLRKSFDGDSGQTTTERPR